MLPAALLDRTGLPAAAEVGPGKVDGVGAPVGGGEACSRGQWPGLPGTLGKLAHRPAGLMPPHAVGSSYGKVLDPSASSSSQGFPGLWPSLQCLPLSPPSLHLCVCVSDLPFLVRTSVVVDSGLVLI